MSDIESSFVSICEKLQICSKFLCYFSSVPFILSIPFKMKCTAVMKYTVSQKKGDTILLSISLLNIDRFSQFFHQHIQ